jgi:hypothetical protein
MDLPYYIKAYAYAFMRKIFNHLKTGGEKMSTLEELQARRRQLKKEIAGSLDLLIGHIRQSPSMPRPTMTLKVSGKTVSRYIKKPRLAKARKMNANHLRVRELITALSEVNWAWLNWEETAR